MGRPRWDAYDAEALTIQIRRTLTYVGGRVSFKAPKSENSRRVIELSAGTVRML